MTDTTTEAAGVEYEGNLFETFDEVRNHIRAQFPHAARNPKRVDQLLSDLAQVDRVEREYVEAAEAEAARVHRESVLGGRTVGEGLARRVNSPEALRRRADRAERAAQFAAEMLDRPSPEERARRFVEARRAEAARLRAAADNGTDPSDDPGDDWPAGWR